MKAINSKKPHVLAQKTRRFVSALDSVLLANHTGGPKFHVKHIESYL